MQIMSMLHRISDRLKRTFLSGNIYARSIGVKVGNSCKISTKNFGSEPYLIEIGNNVHLTSGVQFITHEGGVWIFRNKNPDFDVFGKIKIGSNTYIGNNVTILYGVEIGSNCVIGCGSIVNESIPSNSVAAGVPARVISNVTDFELKMNRYDMKTKRLSNKEKKQRICTAPDKSFIKRQNRVNFSGTGS